MTFDLENLLVEVKNIVDGDLIDESIRKLLIFTDSEIKKICTSWRNDKYQDSELYLQANAFVKEAIKLSDGKKSSSDIVDFQIRFRRYLKDVEREFPNNKIILVQMLKAVKGK